MSVVVSGGTVRPGDRIVVVLAEQPHRPLEPV
jgi:MOSC domain-containing protein YiiM